ncbi:MAG: prolipoprotein diacylglyceryl transferase [Anaerolineales bacterium]|nr:prolipoprotein diacylglyceryl transferase [Anaerolineales bacterium]
MIDPVIFSFKLFGITLALRWYGVLVMFGAVVGAWLAEKEINRRAEKGETIWDALVWVLPAGIIGARLWYVGNATLGGNPYYKENPMQILNIPQGGLHFFGGLLFGAIVLFIYLRQQKKDIWLFLDSIAPSILIGQALARPANYINQELYGPPTTLPWGIQIQANSRLAQYADLSLFPVATTRFHPTFAYEMIWNILAGLFLLWYARQYKERMKPGAVFGAWLVLAGIGRVIIELFRPDQPRIPGMEISYSMVVSALMALAGIVMLLVRYGKLQFAFAENWEDEYQIFQPAKEKMVAGIKNTEDIIPLKRSTPKAAVKAKAKTPAKPKAKPIAKPKAKAPVKPKAKKAAK